MQATSIDSPQNEIFKKFLSLTASKGLKEHPLFLLSGKKLIDEFLNASHTLAIAYEISTPEMPPVSHARQVRLSASLFKEIDVLGTHFNILVVEQPPCPVLTADDVLSYQPRGIELAAPTGDPGNLGALLRSCEAFGVKRVILTREAAHPFLPKTVKASAGSVLRVAMARGPQLGRFPDTCLALDPQGQSIDHFQWPENALLVLGEEGPGFDAAKFKTRLRIPTCGVESLNVVVAASIALAYASRSRNI